MSLLVTIHSQHLASVYHDRMVLAMALIIILDDHCGALVVHSSVFRLASVVG